MEERDQKTIQEEKIESLLSEFNNLRLEIRDMIVDLERIRAKIDVLIPDSLDARYMRFFEEKVKSVTGLFNSLLDMRKEIAKSIKDEIDIRRRVSAEDKLIDLEDMLDIRSMARKVDEFKTEKDKHQKKRIKENKEQTIEEGIDIPGITSRVEGYKNG